MPDFVDQRPRAEIDWTMPRMLSRIILKLLRILGVYHALRGALLKDLRRPLAEQIEPAVFKKTRRSLAGEVSSVGEDFQQHLERKLQKHQARIERESAKTLKALDAIERQLSKQSQLARRIKALERLAAQHGEDQEDLSATLNRISAQVVNDHVTRQIRAAEVLPDPFPHILVENLFPDDVYKLLVEAIPALDFFPDRDPIKRNFKPSQPLAPPKSKTVWRYLNTTFCGEILLPALVAKFDPFLDGHYAAIFGEEFVDRARALPQENSRGRLMCRRPGYHLRPHLDPKRVLLTALLYLPKSRDEGEQFGTQIFKGDRPFVAQYVNTYFPEQDGVNFELVKTLPFRWNSLAVFMNSGAAHGAEIPPDTTPSDLERYAFQFYIGPEQTALDALIDDLPEERQAAWRARSQKGEAGQSEQSLSLVD